MGPIPSHWEIHRLRSILRPVNARSRPDLPLLSVVRERGVILRDTENTQDNHNVIPEDLSNYKIVRLNQFAINKMKAWQGSYGVSDHEGIVSPAYFVFDVDNINHKFLHRATRSRAYVPLFNRASDGVRIGQWDLSQQQLRDIPIAIPPKDEQAAIVRYLDHADELIRHYIRAKQKLIALLEEQRQAVIHQAVTRGLDPKVQLKDSGVEWLGDVPHHWQLRQLKQVSTILRGKFTHRPRNDPSLYGGPYPFIQTGDVTAANKMITKHKQTLNEQGLAVSAMFPAGTLVMTIAANIGDVAVLDFNACFPDSVVGFFPNKNAERDFLYYLFQAIKPELLREAPVNTQGNLNVNRIGSKIIPLPSTPEQVTIIDCLDEATVRIDAAIDHTHRQVELISEYRTRLIADVVTGQIDVRNTPVELPD